MQRIIGSAIATALSVAGAGCSGSSVPEVPDANVCPAVTTSCPANCGPNGDSDCCESPLITGGTFYRDFDVANDGKYADMTHPATISDFRLDKYEVTVGRFRAFVEAGMGTWQCPPGTGAGAHDRIPGSGWDENWKGFLSYDTPSLIGDLKCDPKFATWTDQPGANENLPINCVSWYEAMAFCISDGGYLPTTAEWNFAASGGTDQRAYPWSQPPGSPVIDCTDASYLTMFRTCAAVIPVGSKPAGNARWGQADMAGNVWEWNLDWASVSVIPSYIDPCVDCAKLTQDPNWSYREVRGGDFNADSHYLRTSFETGADPSFDRYDYEDGIRCARSVP
jgi:sulfatase modifying factor 1